ncbi:PREDICTED: m7GpppX diphosphatase [Nicrophorus vespilloides]|uniref:m7GpppX diphosphatase n=1 Tax=Nicrophorus vespilloides TaxID=110193 RepID=A0ABM1MTV4_NICVS|nr:PREDICTED: m7GpppX diphosphatase [Nicrophorus vespilloides]
MSNMSSNESEPVCKKPKIETEIEKESVEGETNVHKDLKNFSAFSLDKILYNNSNRKSVCLQGSFDGLSGTAIVLLEKTAFEDEKLKEKGAFFNEKSELKQIFQNDIYGNYECFPEYNPIKTTIIHPATDKHISKYSGNISFMVDETPELYKNIILPHIIEEQFDLSWLYNILDHKKEVERIIYEDNSESNGFVLLPDMKWDGKTIETLHILALVHTRGIKSLRDLSKDHLTLLKNIQTIGQNIIQEKYNIPASQLRVYLHYQPSFYHLHVHFTYLQFDAPGIYTERAHLLSNVISNLELLSDYYQKVSLPFVVQENSTLCKILKSKGILN